MDERGVALLGAAAAPLLCRPYFAGGDPCLIVAALAHVPEALEVALPFFAMVLGPSAIDLRTKEIVILRTSARAGCRYCVESHTLVAIDAGLSTGEVRALRAELPFDEAFTGDDDLSLIAWCDAVAFTGPIDPSVRDRFEHHRPDHMLVELTLLVATTLLLNRFRTALRLPTSEDVLSRLASVGLAS